MATLKGRVDGYFSARALTKKANGFMIFKCVFLLVAFAGVYAAILAGRASTTGLLALAVLFGIVSALVGLNIAHDAVHNAISNHWVINRLLSYTFNLIGANQYVWRITHNEVHHAYPNVFDVDPDIDQSPLLRMSPFAPCWKVHRYQHLYAPALYLLFGFYLVFIKDFRVLFWMRRLGNKQPLAHPRREYVILFVTKTLYLAYMVFIPYWVLGLPFGHVLVGFAAVQLVTAVIFSVVTVPAHVVQEAAYPKPDAQGKLEGDWALHQMHTTLDFNPDSALANWLTGGGNTQVIHHLFPEICHVHHPALVPIVERTAREFGILYQHTSLLRAWRSHFALLKIFGRRPATAPPSAYETSYP
jgi:linoleoyl-CoA desaturase